VEVISGAEVMLFDPKPKRRREDLFDFDNELNSLARFVNDPSTRLIVVRGLRRTGKTSLTLTALNGLTTPYVFIDVREFVRSRRGLYELLSRALSEFLRAYDGLGLIVREFRRALMSVRGVRIEGFGVSISWGRDRPLISELLRELDRVAGRSGVRLPLVIDEAQRLGGPLGLEFWNAVAHAYDFLDNLVLIITGSEMGVLEKVLGDPESPMYGRAFVEVSTRKLTRAESREFLSRGFSELGIKVPEDELTQAVNLLDGVVGWLTYYGYERAVGGRDVKSIVNEAIKLARQELENFLSTRVSTRYRAILKMLAAGIKEWGDIKRGLEQREGRTISDRVIHEALTALKQHSIIDENLNLTDPILRMAAETL